MDPECYDDLPREMKIKKKEPWNKIGEEINRSMKCKKKGRQKRKKNTRKSIMISKGRLGR